MDKDLKTRISKAKKAGQKRFPHDKNGNIKELSCPDLSKAHRRSKCVLRRKLQTYRDDTARLLPIVLPSRLKNYYDEEFPPQKNGTIVKIYSYECEDYRFKLTYSLPPGLLKWYSTPRQRMCHKIDYPTLGKDLKPVCLALLNLASVQKSAHIIFKPEDIADQIYMKRIFNWRQHIKDLIVTIGTTSYELEHNRKKFTAYGNIGNLLIAGANCHILMKDIRLRKGEILFHFNDDWLLPLHNPGGKIPYFLLQTDRLRQMRDLPEWMQNGWLWLARHRYLLPKMRIKMETFLASAFRLAPEEISNWKKWGELTEKWRKFVREMKKKQIIEYIKFYRKPKQREKGESFSNSVFTIQPTDLFLTQARVTLPEPTKENKQAIQHLMKLLNIYGWTNARGFMNAYKLGSGNETIDKLVSSGEFDRFWKKGIFQKYGFLKK